MISSECKYRIINDRDLDDDVRDEICNDCKGNDTMSLASPLYNPKFKKFLEENGEDSTQSFIINWSR
jgi:hypothetical protein